MPYMGDVCAACGTYEDQQGNAKSRFVRIGAWFESDQGALSVKLDAIPLQDHKGECWLKLFPKKDENQQPGDAPQQQAPAPQQQQQRQAPAPQQQQQQSRGRSRY